MRRLDTLEGKLKYAHELVDDIKGRQSILGTKLELSEVLSGGLSLTVPEFSVRRVRVLFTPTDGNNGYAEMGFTDNFNPNVVVECYSDPAYASSTTQQAWIISYTNVTFNDESVNLTASVISLASGTISLGAI